MTPTRMRMITTMTITPTIPTPPFLEFIEDLRCGIQGLHNERPAALSVSMSLDLAHLLESFIWLTDATNA
jgi:hypothetical protein